MAELNLDDMKRQSDRRQKAFESEMRRINRRRAAKAKKLIKARAKAERKAQKQVERLAKDRLKQAEKEVKSATDPLMRTRLEELAAQRQQERAQIESMGQALRKTHRDQQAFIDNSSRGRFSGFIGRSVTENETEQLDAIAALKTSNEFVEQILVEDIPSIPEGLSSTEAQTPASSEDPTEQGSIAAQTDSMTDAIVNESRREVARAKRALERERERAEKAEAEKLLAESRAAAAEAKNASKRERQERAAAELLAKRAGGSTSLWGRLRQGRPQVGTGDADASMGGVAPDGGTSAASERAAKALEKAADAKRKSEDRRAAKELAAAEREARRAEREEQEALKKKEDEEKAQQAAAQRELDRAERARLREEKARIQAEEKQKAVDAKLAAQAAREEQRVKDDEERELRQQEKDALKAERAQSAAEDKVRKSLENAEKKVKAKEEAEERKALRLAAAAEKKEADRAARALQAELSEHDKAVRKEQDAARREAERQERQERAAASAEAKAQRNERKMQERAEKETRANQQREKKNADREEQRTRNSELAAEKKQLREERKALARKRAELAKLERELRSQSSGSSGGSPTGGGFFRTIGRLFGVGTKTTEVTEITVLTDENAAIEQQIDAVVIELPTAETATSVEAAPTADEPLTSEVKITETDDTSSFVVDAVIERDDIAFTSGDVEGSNPGIDSTSVVDSDVSTAESPETDVTADETEDPSATPSIEEVQSVEEILSGYRERNTSENIESPLGIEGLDSLLENLPDATAGMLRNWLHTLSIDARERLTADDLMRAITIMQSITGVNTEEVNQKFEELVAEVTIRPLTGRVITYADEPGTVIDAELIEDEPKITQAEKAAARAEAKKSRKLEKQRLKAEKKREREQAKLEKAKLAAARAEVKRAEKQKLEETRSAAKRLKAELKAERERAKRVDEEGASKLNARDRRKLAKLEKATSKKLAKERREALNQAEANATSAQQGGSWRTTKAVINEAPDEVEEKAATGAGLSRFLPSKNKSDDSAPTGEDESVAEELADGNYSKSDLRRLRKEQAKIDKTAARQRKRDEKMATRQDKMSKDRAEADAAEQLEQEEDLLGGSGSLIRARRREIGKVEKITRGDERRLAKDRRKMESLDRKAEKRALKERSKEAKQLEYETRAAEARNKAAAIENERIIAAAVNSPRIETAPEMAATSRYTWSVESGEIGSFAGGSEINHLEYDLPEPLPRRN